MSDQSTTIDYARLDALPELAAQADSLIEEAFAYQKNFKFSVDFAPLTSPRNHHNRHVLVDTASQRVLAHVGLSPRNFVWDGEVIPVALLGGIAVAPGLRGQGLFQLLFERVLAQAQSQCAFFLLWSDKHELYEKWDFHLAGKQWCYRAAPAKESLAPATKLEALPRDERERLAAIYRTSINRRYFSPLRDETDWDELCRITSADLHLFKEGYAFRNKGMDLTDVFHDLAHAEGIEALLPALYGHGQIWAPENLPVADDIYVDLQQVGLWKPNHHPMALRKLSHLLGLEVNFRDGRFCVDRDGLLIKLRAEELLAELFNYGNHGLRKEAIPIYIGGLDSI